MIYTIKKAVDYLYDYVILLSSQESWETEPKQINYLTVLPKSPILKCDQRTRLPRIRDGPLSLYPL